MEQENRYLCEVYRNAKNVKRMLQTDQQAVKCQRETAAPWEMDRQPRYKLRACMAKTATGEDKAMSREQGFNEKDWKLFKSKLPDWQERYMDKLNHEYMEILNGEGKPSDKFWALEGRIREDKKDTGVVVRETSRSNMLYHVMDLIREGAIGIEDLAEFSEELRETVKAFAGRDAL